MTTGNQVYEMVPFEENQKSLSKKACPKCGLTSKDFSKEGKLGCAFCYEYFYTKLLDILESCHDGRNQHYGKIPINHKKEKIEYQKNIEEEILNLEQKMKNAISVENYEIAGILKQKIEELKLSGLI